MDEMAIEWITYRTRFLIKARRLTAPLSFVDCLGREHSGRKGDYLVLSSEGCQRIAPREIFEDIYVPMDEVASARLSESTNMARGELLPSDLSPGQTCSQPTSHASPSARGRNSGQPAQSDDDFRLDQRLEA